jgi:hypothetical protein
MLKLEKLNGGTKPQRITNEDSPKLDQKVCASIVLSLSLSTSKYFHFQDYKRNLVVGFIILDEVTTNQIVPPKKVMSPHSR